MQLVALQIFEAFHELSFVLKILVFVYLAYFLFLTFRGGVVFGLATLAAAYLVFFYSISTTLLFITLLVFTVFSNHFQMLIDFGFARIFQMAGKAPPWEPHAVEYERLQALERKNVAGELTGHEADEYAELMSHHNPQALLQPGAPQRPRRRLF
jgi:hypothetical protein